MCVCVCVCVCVCNTGAICQGVCESNQALGYKFHRAVPTTGESTAYMKRARLLQHVAETEVLPLLAFLLF
jgi:hypothetical protein